LRSHLEMSMKHFTNDSDFVASLDPSQGEYFLNRLAETQHQVQDIFRDLSRGIGAVAGLNSDLLSLLSEQPGGSRRVLTVKGTEYRYATVPGSARIKLIRPDGTAIAMWDGSTDDPWVLRLAGFEAFQLTGHADAVSADLGRIDNLRKKGGG
jgi:hypothetical protein